MRQSAMVALAALLLAGCSGSPEPWSAAESAEPSADTAPEPEPSAAVSETPEDEPPGSEPAEDGEELDTLRAAAVSLTGAALEFGYMNLMVTVGGGTEEGCPDERDAALASLSEIEDLPSAELRVAVADMKHTTRFMAVACQDGFSDDLKDDWDGAYRIAEVELEQMIIDAGG
jgi:hypothetical protein